MLLGDTLIEIAADMIISVKETTVFSVFHPDAHDLFNTCSDLKKVAWELWNPKRRLNQEVCESIRLNIPLLMVLRSRTKMCSSSVRLRRCYASDPLARSRNL